MVFEFIRSVTYYNRKAFLGKRGENGELAMAKEISLTQAGFDKLTEELEILKTQKRQEIAEKIKEARSFGDLSENSEYDAAKNEQAMIEARILEVEAQLKNAKILNTENLDSELIHVGSKVRVFNVDFEDEIVLQIVGSTESDPDEGKISDESPVGKALLGHKAGETVKIAVPSGAIVSYEIKEIII